MRRAVILLALLGIALAAPKTGSRIVGGSETTIDQYPYVTNMQYWIWIGWLNTCVGSLITPGTILSAAHCYDGDSPSSWRVRVGTHFPSCCGDAHNVQSFIIHENYNPITMNNDVAIVRLTSHVTLSQTVQTARVSGPNFQLDDGTRVTTLGWGNTQHQGDSARVLRVVDVYTINHQLCTQRYAGNSATPNVTPQMMCAGVLDVGGRDACQGDSGGPLVHNRDVLVGIVSWRYRCGDEHYPGVYTSVPALSEWIQRNGAS